MSGIEIVAAQLPELIGVMAALGFCAGAFVVLVTAGLCSVIHGFFKMMEGR